MSLTERIVDLAIALIGTTGYAGVFLLMTLESMVFPVPSEAVMPFAGFLVFQHTFNFFLIIIVSTAGSIVGSLISYWIGRYGGRYLVARFGKYVLISHHDLDMTERFFVRYGEKTVFISRFIPVIRHFISIPAGVGEMRLTKFLLYTTVGAALWNTFLAYLGLQLGERWTILKAYGHTLDLLVLGLLVLAVIFLVFRARKRRQAA